MKETQDASSVSGFTCKSSFRCEPCLNQTLQQSNVGGFAAREVQHSKALCLKAIVWAFQSDRTSISKIIRVGAGRREELILQMEL